MGQLIVNGYDVDSERRVEGKTKIIYPLLNTPDCLVISKNDITAGDGKRHAKVEGKGKISNLMSGLIFGHLKKREFPVAWEKKMDDVTFRSTTLVMWPLEVVSRFEAFGAHCKRTGMTKGTKLPTPLVQFHLKTAGRKWKSVWDGKVYDLPCDDPLMAIENNLIHLHEPGSHEGTPAFLTLTAADIFIDPDWFRWIDAMRTLAHRATLEVREIGQKVGIWIPDYKWEFGMAKSLHAVTRRWTDSVFIGDVADLESGRAIYTGEKYPELKDQHICKQYFRDGGTPEETVRRYGIGLELFQEAIAPA